jgi:ATP-dependent helicase HrpB
MPTFGRSKDHDNGAQTLPRFDDMTLPIDSLLSEIIRHLRTGPALLLRAPTGAGKTTRVPPALLEFGKVLVVEPRRLAARSAAKRMAEERGERLGDTVGYHVRFDRQAGPKTRLLVATPGILLRLLLDDAALERFDVVVFDEFHERGLESDLALGMVKLIQQTVRPELRVVVMSATLQTEGLAEYLGNCPIVTSEGRLYPIETRYREPPLRERTAVSVAAAVIDAAAEREGDVLAFLPGVGEIRQTAAELDGWAKANDVLLAPLYGDLPIDRQDAALRKQSRRKVVLATNVAETSVTVEGVAIVIDSGLARQVEFDPAVGMDRLTLTRISRASADQRAGRAGRTGPGLCIRLWGEASHRTRDEQTSPEIRRVDLAGPTLHLLALGERDLVGFPWLEAPRPAAIEQARLLLDRLGATVGGALTDIGATMARLPVHPRLARLLVEGCRRGIVDQTALVAALLSERDPFLRETAPPSRGPTHSDLLDRAGAVADFERTGRSQSPFGQINISAAEHLLHVRDQLSRLVRDEAVAARAEPDDVALDAALLAAFPDRLARRRDGDPRRGVMVGGRGVRLAPSSGVVEGELFLCLDVDAGDREATVRLASAIPRSALPVEQLQNVIQLSFDEASERVVARKQLSFLDLMIEETPAHVADPENAAHILADAAINRLERILPAAETPAGKLRIRLRWLRDAMPGIDLPEFGDADLAQITHWLSAGKKSFAELRTADWRGAIESRLSHRQLQTLDREAPESLTVPSGSRIALNYEVGKPPILAVRIQEMFGLAETPRLAGGRVKVLLHLLAPSFRPQQVTDDLASFWKNTYPTVRKELRIRYPKHAWPEDPWNAPPQRGPRKSRRAED